MRRELAELERCLRRRFDEETVHALRVSARRLEAELALRGLRVLRSDLRWVIREFAEVRDLDVAMTLWREPTFVRWCVRRRARAVKALEGLRGDGRVKGLLRALGALPEDGGARRSLRRWRERAETRRELVRRAPSLESFHGLRRAARRLRYGLERRGEDATRPQALQSALGDVCDLLPLFRLLNVSGQGEVAERLKRCVERALAPV